MTHDRREAPLSILAVHNRYRQRGGEDVVFEAETALLERHGHRVERIQVDNADLPDPRGPADHLRLAMRTIWSSASARAIRRAIRRFGPDVIHAHNTFPLISPSIYDAGAGLGVPVVHTLHNFRMVCPKATLFRDGRPCEDCVGRRLAVPSVIHACYQDSRPRTAVVAAMLAVQHARDATSRASGFIVPSQFARDVLARGGLPIDRMFVKANFVDPDPGGDGQEDGGRFLFAGRLSVDKGVETLVRAWRSVPDEIQLDVVGDGPLRPLVSEAAGTMGNVTFHGELDRSAVMGLMRRARAVLVPSRWYEVAPLTVIEAFANATPVIAADIGSLRELVEHERTGLRSVAGDPADLARTVQRLAADETLARRLGLQAREEYLARYTGNANYAQLQRIYGVVIGSAQA